MNFRRCHNTFSALYIFHLIGAAIKRSQCEIERKFLLDQRPFDEKGPGNKPHACIHLIVIKGNISRLSKISGEEDLAWEC